MIPESAHKGNNLRLALIMAALVVLVGIAAFGLGRLSAPASQQGGLIIHPAGEAAQ